MTLSYPPNRPVPVSETDYFGIPVGYIQPPDDLEELMELLQGLESARKGLDGLGRKGLFGFGRKDNPFQKIAQAGASGREIYIRDAMDIVVKFDFQDNSGFSGNSREASNFSTYEDNLNGVLPCFPVWGATRGSKFLIMARAEDVPLFSDSREMKDIAGKISKISEKYVPDPSIQNMGFINRDGIRYWATVDIDFTEVEFY